MLYETSLWLAKKPPVTFGNQIVCQRTPRFISRTPCINHGVMTNRIFIGTLTIKLWLIRKVLHFATALGAITQERYGENRP